MFTLEVGGIYYTHDEQYIQIVHINKELLKNSTLNKCVTVLFLATNSEYITSYAALDTWGIKYLGRNLGVAQVLYGSNLKAKLGQT